MERYKRLISFSIIFIISGILHVLLRTVDLTSCFSQIFYGFIVLVWGMQVNDRIIDRRVRNLIWGIVLFLEMYFLLQICRYRLSSGYNRTLWYSYEIPMLVIPLLFFYLTLYMNRQKDDAPGLGFIFVSIPVFVLIPLIMTNDFHQLFIRLNGTMTDSIGISNAGILVYICRIYSVGILVSAFILLFYKCQISISKQKILQLIIILCVCIFLLLSYAIGLSPKINGVKLWDIGELFAIVSIYILETCMQIGLIQVNTKYTWIFQETDLPAVISDNTGKYVYLTKGADAVLNPSKESFVRSSDIRGGSVSWAVDLSAVNELNRQITTTIEQIDTRNHYLTTQNAIKEEMAAVDARNKVYDRIAGIVSNRLGRIEELLAEEEQDFSQRLKKIVVYNAYIKRRSNLELLRESEEKIPAVELFTAISESVSYLKLNQIDVALNFGIDGNISVEAGILAYDFFEAVAETVLNKASMLSVNLTEKEGTLSLRMLTDISDCSFIDDWSCDELVICNGKINKTENDRDCILALLFEKGGAEL